MKTALALFALIISSSCALPQNEFYPSSFVGQRETWTWMIYMNADNDLSGSDILNLNQLLAIESDDPIHIIVLWDRAGNFKNRLIKIEPGKIIDLSSTINGVSFPGTDAADTEINMADRATLYSFISYAKNQFPAKRYALTFWSHSDGWRKSVRGISTDENDGDSGTADDYLNVLKNEDIAWAMGLNGGVDVMAFDSCLQGSIETLWALYGVADYMVASPHNVPSAGWNYYDFLKRFLLSYRRVDDFLYTAIESYRNYYEKTGWEEVSLAAYDVSALNKNEGPGTLKDFLTWLYNGGAPIAGEKELFLASNMFYAAGAKHVDLYHYLSRSTYNSHQDFKPVLLSMVKALVRYSWIKGLPENYPGVSILLPFVGDEMDYELVPFAVDTQWNETANQWN